MFRLFLVIQGALPACIGFVTQFIALAFPAAEQDVDQQQLTYRITYGIEE